MNDFLIRLQNASVCYPAAKFNKLTDLIFRRASPLGNMALRDINLTINRGERVGLIGLNGAGKSTLLKLMAKIYQPTAGHCYIQGKICPLFELATGFEMDMNGWSNIKIRAMLLGMSTQEINHKIKEIAEFTELGKFLDDPVRTYSSGMFIRLAFAISTAITPEILLLDEIFGAGDLSFTQKASQRMEGFIEKGQIIVLSTHSPTLLEKFCTRTIWLHQGVLMMDGPSHEVWSAYSKFTNKLNLSLEIN